MKFFQLYERNYNAKKAIIIWVSAFLTFGPISILLHFFTLENVVFQVLLAASARNAGGTIGALGGHYLFALAFLFVFPLSTMSIALPDTTSMGLSAIFFISLIMGY